MYTRSSKNFLEYIYIREETLSSILFGVNSVDDRSTSFGEATPPAR